MDEKTWLKNQIDQLNTIVWLKEARMDEKTWLKNQIDQLNWLRNMKGKAATSDSARYYAVTITELEKVIAYFETWVLSGTDSGETGIE